MLERRDTIAATARAFRWRIPERYNIGADICDRWAEADPGRLALIDAPEGGPVRRYGYGDLRDRSNRLANLLCAEGLSGARIGVLLPQRVETAVTHIAVLKTGGISLPLFTLFGPDALRHRLHDSGAEAVVTDAAGLARLTAIRADLPALRHVWCVDGAGPGGADLAAACVDQSDAFTPADTRADDPAILIYTSGTTGQPKGALHAHRVLLGHLPGVEMSHDFLPQPGDRIWTPADWAWIGGLLDVMMPALHHGVPVVACRFRKFTARAALDLMEAQGVRNAFLPPTALKMLRRDPETATRGLRLRSVASGGETLGAELIDWGRRAFGTTINEFYGQTECNMIVSSCGSLEDAEPGVMGFPVPGHRVSVIGPDGADCGVEEEGDIAVLSPDPVMFLGYLNRPGATAEKFREGPEGRWLLTGDRGAWTATGRLRFVGREDDVIGSAGYRIGPAEVEDCLLGHPAVQMAGVVGRPDALRGQVVAAYVQLVEGVAPSDALAEEIAAHVKTRLAAHEYPRVVRFIDEMPLTTTGKIIRARLREMAREEVEGA